MLTKNYHVPKLITPKQEADLLAECDEKYTCIVLLMLDGGLRVTECISLQRKDFNFMENQVVVKTLKKREADAVYRYVPLTQRLLIALAEYWKELKDKRPEAYLFPSGKGSETPHLGRKQVCKQIKKKSNGRIHPHMLRHTCATKIVSEGNDIRVAKELLGHKKVATTEIYLHIEQEKVKRAIASIEKTPLYLKLYRKFFPLKTIHLTPATEGITKFHIGRKKELRKLA